MPRHPVASIIAVVLAVAPLVACGDDDDDTGGANTTTTSGASADLTAAATASMASVCDAVDAASTDAAKAETSFQSIHDQLHELGDALTERDRTAAEAFLRAKTTVEADFTGDVDPGKLTSDLGELANQLALAVDTLGIDAPGC